MNNLSTNSKAVHRLIITAVPKNSIEGEPAEEKTIEALSERNDYAASLSIVQQTLGAKWTAWETIEVTA